MSDEPYCKVSRRMWTDAAFWRLSPPQPNAQSLWQHILTGQHYKTIPGLFVLSVEAMAGALRWPVDATRRCFDEILAQEMARFDPETNLVWLPAALHHNKPKSVNNITGWSKDWRMLPECALLQEATEFFRQFLAGMSQACLDAFDRAIRPDRPSRKGGTGPASPKPQSTPIRDGSRTPDLDPEKEPDPEISPVCVDPVPDTKRGKDVAAHTQSVDLTAVDPNAPIAREHIQALVDRYPDLGRLWPEHVERLYVVANCEHMLRFGQVQRAFKEWFAKRSLDCEHMPPPDLYRDIASYVASADLRRGGGRSREPDAPTEDVAAVFSVFDPIWCKRLKAERRPKDARDDYAAAHIATEVKVHAKAIGAPRWGEVLKTAVKLYLELDEQNLKLKEYPLWEMQNRLATVLKEIRTKRPDEPKAAQAPEPVINPAENAKAAARARADFFASQTAQPEWTKPRRPAAGSLPASSPSPPPTPPVKASLAPATGHPAGGSDPRGAALVAIAGRIERDMPPEPGADCAEEHVGGLDVATDAGEPAPPSEPPAAITPEQRERYLAGAVPPDLLETRQLATMAGQAKGRRTLAAPLPGIAPARDGPMRLDFGDVLGDPTAALAKRRSGGVR